MQKMNLKHIHFEFQPNFGALNVDGLSSTKIFRGWFFFFSNYDTSLVVAEHEVF